MTFSKKESRELSAVILASFLASGQSIAKELETVPPCRACGHVPRQYSRFNDGTVQCAADDVRACYSRQG